METLIACLLIGLLVLICVIGISRAHAQLEDPNNKDVVYLNELPIVSKLNGYGCYLIRIYRQSGNTYAEHQTSCDAKAAINLALATFRRAKIEGICVLTNTESRLEFRRLYHDHRGRAEGKKVGGAKIERIS
jgi:hypothetical protein